MKTYSLYPSLFDAYVYMQSAEDAEQYAERKQALLDSLNRVPSEPSEAASRGTALNNLVDCVVKDTLRPDYETYEASIDGFGFTFDGKLVSNLASLFRGCICQCFTSAEIETSKGVVRLYGYPDYVCGDVVLDLKTTSTYTVGKYREKWQSKVYPYCLVTSQQIAECAEFRYVVAELEKDRQTGVISGEIYGESYYNDFATCANEIRHFLECDFLPFIEDNRHLIINNRIFQS